MDTRAIRPDFGLLVTPTCDEDLDPIAPGWILHQLGSAAGGLLLFRGFPTTEQMFARFSEKLGTRFLVHHNTEGRDYVGGDMTFATVAKGNRPIDVHIEMASSPVKPEVLWFYCVAPALWRGRIGFADGRTVLNGLTKRSRAVLEEQGFRYEFRNLPPTIWRPVWEAYAARCNDSRRAVTRLMRKYGRLQGIHAPSVDDNDTLSFDYHVAPIFESPLCRSTVFACGLLDNPLRTLMGDGSAVDRALYIEVAQATYQSAVWLDWRAGDVAVVDNTRIMHSREAFEDAQRRVLVRYSKLGSGLA